MNVLNLQTVTKYCQAYPEAATALIAWHKVTVNANWANLNELKKDFPSADLIADSRVIFNIKGNHFRLIARVAFKHKRVMLKWFGTHKEYDKINASEV